MTKEDAKIIRCFTAESTLDPKSVALLSLVGRRYYVSTVGLTDVRV